MKRCTSTVLVHGRKKREIGATVRCDLPAGHSDEHTALLVVSWPIRVEWPRRYAAGAKR